MTKKLMESPDFHAARNLAVACGDSAIAYRREFARVLEENNGDWLRAAKHGVKELHRRGLISNGEVGKLDTICDAVFGQPSAQTYQDLRDWLHEMIIDQDASPVAIAIASGVTSTLGTPPSTKSGAIARTRISPEQGMLGGAIIGAVVGGAVGGFGGAAIGAFVGVIVGGTLGVCDTVSP